MEQFIPATANELYQKMLTWDNLHGHISYDEKSTRITWHVAENLTHWHPDVDVIYEEMHDINEGKVKFAYKNTLRR